MNTNATGQFFGYTLQFPRALLRLLEMDGCAKVGIEIRGDVAEFYPDGSVVTEEDKSSLTGNTLTNRSTNLWKTFYNWINAIKAGEFDVARDRFVLYTNHPVPDDSLVKMFANVSDEISAQAALDKSRDILNDISIDSELFKYTNKVFHEQSEIFKQILLLFDFIADRKAYILRFAHFWPKKHSFPMMKSNCYSMSLRDGWR